METSKPKNNHYLRYKCNKVKYGFLKITPAKGFCSFEPKNYHYVSYELQSIQKCNKQLKRQIRFLKDYVKGRTYDILVSPYIISR